MEIIKVENRILWNKKDSRLVTANGSDIFVEVESRPTSGFGFLLAEHPSDQSRNIRWYIDHVTGRSINPNSTNQLVLSGGYLQLFPDTKKPRPKEWKVYLSAVRVEF